LSIHFGGKIRLWFSNPRFGYASLIRDAEWHCPSNFAGAGSFLISLGLANLGLDWNRGFVFVGTARRFSLPGCWHSRSDFCRLHAMYAFLLRGRVVVIIAVIRCTYTGNVCTSPRRLYANACLFRAKLRSDRS